MDYSKPTYSYNSYASYSYGYADNLAYNYKKDYSTYNYAAYNDYAYNYAAGD